MIAVVEVARKLTSIGSQVVVGLEDGDAGGGEFGSALHRPTSVSEHVARDQYSNTTTFEPSFGGRQSQTWVILIRSIQISQIPDATLWRIV